MRISSTLFFQTGLNSINAQQADLMHLFQQIGSGQRMVTPADDPLGAAQAINISQAQSLNMRFDANRGTAMQNLGIEDNTLNSLTALIQGVKTRLIEAGNGTMSDADRQTLSDVLAQAKQTLLGLANATDGNGQYLFSGSKGDIAPYSDAGNPGRYIYMGDQMQRNIQVDQTRQLAGSDIGTDVFGRATPGSSTYLSAASAANQGDAVISTPRIADASFAGFYSSHDYELTFSSDNTYSVEVRDQQGDHVQWLFVDEPYTPSAEATLTFGAMQVKFSGQARQGDTFTVIPARQADLNIFDTLQDMIDTLAIANNDNPAAQAKFRNVLASSMQRLDLNYDNILTVQASVGARMNEIEALNANGSLRNLGFRNQLSQLQDLDYYSASSQLELRKSALEAAALAFRKIQGISLFNMGSG